MEDDDEGRGEVERERWRRDVQGMEGVRLVFLVSRGVTEEDEKRLKEPWRPLNLPRFA